ncbi:MAG: ferrous iron transport protein B [Gemmataceae bacterium]
MSISPPSSEPSHISRRTLTVALVGNPNAGKTTLFNALSGLRHRVGNYPGVTVEITKARCRLAQDLELIDLPGTYSLAPRSPDEMVAVDLLLGHCTGEPRPDAIIAVVDASNLDRHLYLVTQLFELGLPVVVALNMFDVAERQHIKIDVAKLEESLGVRVVPTQANRAIGIDNLIKAVSEVVVSGAATRRCEFPTAFCDEVTSLAAKLPNVEPFMLRRLILDIGGSTEERLITQHGPSLAAEVQAARVRLEKASCPVPAVEARTRYGWIKRITGTAVIRSERPAANGTDRLDRILTHKVWGTLVFVVVMAVVFQSIFTAALPLMDWLKAGKNWLGDLTRAQMSPGPFTSLLTDGVIEGVGSVVVFLPQILILFGLLAILEDCGYMARAAFLMDKLMARCGLSGKSFIPLLSSVACAVPGVMATRVIENRRDRLATILVAPLMSCSARLPLYTLLIAAFLTAGHAWWLPGLTLLAMYSIGFIAAPLVALTLKRTLLRGPTPLFVMEMPQYQWPHWKSVVLKMHDRAKAFLFRAGTFILASMIVVWALLYYPATDANGQSYDLRIAELRQGGEANERQINELTGAWRRQSVLGRIGRSIEPAVRPLGWDWKIAMAAVASFPAREVVVGVLGQIYNLGQRETDDLQEPLGNALKQATWDDQPGGRVVFTIPAAFSLMVFFALCCQCASTLAVIRRETRSWRWPAFTFAYMTALAYGAALVTYQIGSRIG